MSSTRLEGVFSVTIFCLPRRFQNIFWYLKTFSKHILISKARDQSNQARKKLLCHVIVKNYLSNVSSRFSIIMNVTQELCNITCQKTFFPLLFGWSGAFSFRVWFGKRNITLKISILILYQFCLLCWLKNHLFCVLSLL